MFVFYVVKEHSVLLHVSKYILYVVKERSAILYGSKEMRSRQNYFRQVAVPVPVHSFLLLFFARWQPFSSQFQLNELGSTVSTKRNANF